MTTIAIVSQKGGAGKTTLAIHLAAAAERKGEVALIIDADPQATASQWAAWREEAPPEVIDSAPPRIAPLDLRALVEDGRMRVPEEISLVGFDDIAFAAAAAVPLTSLRQPSATIGRTALRVLQRRGLCVADVAEPLTEELDIGRWRQVAVLGPGQAGQVRQRARVCLRLLSRRQAKLRAGVGLRAHVAGVLRRVVQAH